MANILERYKKPAAPKKSREEHMEDAFYREVAEEVQAQKLYDFVRANVRVLIAIALVFLLGVITTQVVIRHNRASNIQAAQLFENAASEQDLVKLAESHSGGMADLALFSAARIDLQSGDAAAGVKKLEQLMDDGASRDFRDLATVYLIGIKGGAMTGRDLEKFADDLLDDDSPYYYTGMLLVAEKYLTEDNAAAANKYLDKIIADKNAPAVIAATAQGLR